MKKILVVTALFSLNCGICFSQDGQSGIKLGDSEKAALEQTIIEKSKAIKSLQCGFVQEKTSALVTGKAVAKGILVYQAPSSLRWEYKEPTPSTLILNGNNAVLLNKDGKKVGDARMLKQLAGMIINVISGESLKDNKQFSTEIFQTDTRIRVVLTPVQKRMKDFYSTIEMVLDGKTLLAERIVLNEASGDKTVISFIDKELDSEIPQSKFSF